MTAPAVDTEIDSRTLEELAPPCDIPQEEQPCPHTAEWIGVKRCCGSVRLICQEHYDAYTALDNRGVVWACYVCHVHFAPGEGLYASLERL